MDFVTVGQLRTDSAKVWDKIAAGEELVIMRKGKPIAIMVATQPCEVENNLRALRGARFDAAMQERQRHAAEHALDRMTPVAINAEIPAARKAHGESDASGH